MAGSAGRAFKLKVAEVERLRVGLGLTVEELASRTDVHIRTLRRWLEGAPAYLRSIKALAAVLGLGEKASAIIEGSPSEADEPSQEAAPPVIQFFDSHTGTNRINISLCISLDEAKEIREARIKSVIEMLKMLLPDNTNVGIIPLATGGAIITIAMTPGNVTAMESATVMKGISAHGVDAVSMNLPSLQKSPDLTTAARGRAIRVPGLARLLLRPLGINVPPDINGSNPPSDGK